MEYLRSCEKCGKEEWHDVNEQHTIQGCLCNKCKEKWIRFHHANYNALELQYPELVKEGKNVAWLAFIRKLEISKEKVNFT